MSLPENIREARLQVGLSQEQVAEALGVSRQAFYGDPGRESAFCSEECRAAYGREMAGIQKHLK